MASCIASEFITVASMPIWSAVTRSMPARASPAPRKMLPPPRTTATCTPGAGDLDQFAGDALEHGRVDAVVGLAQQRLAGELHQDAFVPGCGHGMLLAVKKNPAGAGIFAPERLLRVLVLVLVLLQACLVHHFGDEVVLLLLDAGADFQARDSA